MALLDQIIALLALNDGRDKIYKFLAGFLKILAACSKDKQQQALASAFSSLAASIGSARSVMRMGKFIADVPKYEKAAGKLQKKGFDVKTVIEVLRTVGNSLYILGDNAAFIAKHKLIAASPKAITKYAKLAQFWGFFLAAVLDVFALAAGVGKQESDPVAAKKEIKDAVLGLAKDGSDTLVSMAAVGYFKNVWHPNAYTTGVLTCVSGGVATYSNWNKVAKKK
eukprot:gene4688-3381_t